MSRAERIRGTPCWRQAWAKTGASGDCGSVSGRAGPRGPTSPIGLFRPILRSLEAVGLFAVADDLDAFGAEALKNPLSARPGRLRSETLMRRPMERSPATSSSRRASACSLRRSATVSPETVTAGSAFLHGLENPVGLVAAAVDHLNAAALAFLKEQEVIAEGFQPARRFLVRHGRDRLLNDEKFHVPQPRGPVGLAGRGLGDGRGILMVVAQALFVFLELGVDLVGAQIHRRVEIGGRRQRPEGLPRGVDDDLGLMRPFSMNRTTCAQTM